MDPIAATTLAGQAAGAFLRRSRVSVLVNEDYDTFDDVRVKRFFFPVPSPDRLTNLAGHGGDTVFTKPYEWVKENRGYEVGHTVFEFSIQALNATVALVGGKPVVDDVELVRGIAIVPPPAGGPLEGRYLSVSIDDQTLTCFDGDNPGAPRLPFRFEIPQGTTEAFRVHAFTSARPATWYLKLLFIVNGKKVEIDLRRDNGEGFVTLPYDYPGIMASFQWWSDGWEQVHNSP